MTRSEISSALAEIAREESALMARIKGDKGRIQELRSQRKKLLFTLKKLPIEIHKLPINNEAHE